LNRWISRLIRTVGLLCLSNVPHHVLGDHKICDGMKLQETPSANFSLSFNSKYNLLHLKGPLEIGVVAALGQLLMEHPGLNGIILDSEGGNVYQGRGLAKIIQNHSLSTYSFDVCYSACTIAYVAGTRRSTFVKPWSSCHTMKFPASE